MKKVKLMIATVAVLGFAFSSVPAYADGFAPGEGLYVGVFGGAGTGIAQPKVVTQGGQVANGIRAEAGGTFETTEGGIGLIGIEGGGQVGYGYRMGDLYAGIEGEMAAGDVKFKVTSATPVLIDGSSKIATDVTISSIEATKEWTGGVFGRLGYYINPDTLLALRGGILVSKFEVQIKGSTDYSEDYHGGGPSFGASLESRLSAIDPNLSMRIDTVYTDYLTASVFGIGTSSGHNNANESGHDSEITGAALSARIGIQYSFFDVNSLF